MVPLLAGIWVRSHRSSAFSLTWASKSAASPGAYLRVGIENMRHMPEARAMPQLQTVYNILGPNRRAAYRK
eukprot:scaffold289927_cov32-Tisochrysis_lutea.AAC.2